MINCTFENGRKASLRHVTIDGLIVKYNKILLVKRAAHLIDNPNKYALPGGFMGRDENTKQAVVREVEEETGFKCKIISLFKITDKPDRKGEDRQNLNFTFLMEPEADTGKHDKETSEIKWLDLNNLPKVEEFAFDHFEVVNLYLKYLKSPFDLPLIGETPSLIS
jgi:ADP-ribose pyrophosphatase YjhB (NUDIX family)